MSPTYDEENEYNFDEPEPEGFDPDEEQHAVDDTEVRNGDDSNIVASGDVSAAAAASRGKNKEPKIKKIPDDQRKTTPYMTKYEKARILGTRALQIRLVLAMGRTQRIRES